MLRILGIILLMGDELNGSSILSEMSILAANGID